jgi:hypothetical protein
MKRFQHLAALTLCFIGPWVTPAQANVVTEWNTLAMQCISRPGLGILLDIAIVQAAVHDAIQAIEHKYEPYFAKPPASGEESRAAAAAAAARRVLGTVCPPAAQPALDTALEPYVAGNDPGLAIGYAAGDALLTKLRPTPVLPPFVGGTGPGEWRPTPPGNAPMVFLYFATTEPFVMTSPSQFRPGPPPALSNNKYQREYDEVKKYGAIESHPAVAACPAPSNTDMARFYSGSVMSLWNQAARDIAIDRQLSLGETARLLALEALAAADAAIAVWDSKIHYNYWRPITAIREGANDGNDGTVGDVNWTPFIQSNHFPAGSQTPAYPDYVSGANGLTGAYATALQLFFGTDKMSFEIYKNTPASVAVCTNPRTYRRFSEAMDEVVDARILLGLHFRSADVEARRQGARVATWTFFKALRPTHHEKQAR